MPEAKNPKKVDTTSFVIKNGQVVNEEYERSTHELWPTPADMVKMPVKDKPKMSVKDRPKINAGKYKPHLVQASFIEAVARVREYGVTKYGGEEGWRMMTVTDYLDAMLRHADACRNNPAARDEESGLLHIAQVACNCMFLLELMGESVIPDNWQDIINELKKKYKTAERCVNCIRDCTTNCPLDEVKV